MPLAVIAIGWLFFRGIQATLRGNYLTTAVVIGWTAPVVLLLVGFTWAAVSPVSLRTDVDAVGTKFLSDCRIAALFAIGGLLFIPSAVLYVIFVPRGQIDLPMSRGFQLFSPILIGSALFLVVRGFLSVIRRGGVGFVRLAPSGIEKADIKSTTFTAWDDIVGLGDSAGKHTSKVLVLRLRDGREVIVNGLNRYVPGGGLYWMIQHYWLHRDDRAELVDGRAIERLKAGRFEVGDAVS